MVLISYTDPVTVASGATRAVPTLSTEGMDCLGVRNYRVIVSAASGQLLTGSGWMRCYLWSPLLARWVRNPDLDFPITPSGFTWVNVRDRACAEFDEGVVWGRMLWAPDGVTTDAGVVTTQIEASKEFP